MRDSNGAPTGAENFKFKNARMSEDVPVIDLSSTDFDNEAREALGDLLRERGNLLSKVNPSAAEIDRLTRVEDQISMFKSAREKGTIANA
ncbi:MAG TPA: hypothetical protein P5230_03380 [Candidatus Magasanikbacteria bacterium]|nr:hypothetical protein [Candidatus Magasanikbacteria bacterium]